MYWSAAICFCYVILWLHAQLFLLPHCVPHREHQVTVAIGVRQTCIMCTEIYTGSLLWSALLVTLYDIRQYSMCHWLNFVQCHLHILLHWFTVNIANLLITSKEGGERLQLILAFYTPRATTVLEIVFICLLAHATYSEDVQVQNIHRMLKGYCSLGAAICCSWWPHRVNNSPHPPETQTIKLE
jgi:hypothetical protein